MITKNTAARGIIFAFAFILAVIALVSTAPCTTTKHKDSVGVVMQQTNPNSYIAGDITNVEYAGKPENYGMVIRVQPLKAYMLYTDELFLCGDPSELFAGHQNPMVLVYRTRSSHVVDGIGCHELVGVRDVLPENLK